MGWSNVCALSAHLVVCIVPSLSPEEMKRKARKRSDIGRGKIGVMQKMLKEVWPASILTKFNLGMQPASSRGPWSHVGRVQLRIVRTFEMRIAENLQKEVWSPIILFQASSKDHDASTGLCQRHWYSPICFFREDRGDGGCWEGDVVRWKCVWMRMGTVQCNLRGYYDCSSPRDTKWRAWCNTDVAHVLLVIWPTYSIGPRIRLDLVHFVSS